MQLTWLDSNSWLIELGGKNILLDPWLVGNLSFGDLPWLFLGSKTIDRPIPANIDLILLSQGLPDHAHIPTLEVLDRSIPVVGSPSAAKVVQKLGYQQVTALAPGESYRFAQIDIKAVPGSPVGPTAIENGYILRADGTSLYYEPHGYHSPTLSQEPEIDIVITPLIDLKLPLLGPVIKGKASAIALCELLKPKFIVPTAAGGDIKFEGLLMSILTAEGTVAEFADLLTSKSLATKTIDPQPWQPFSLELAKV
ncbi:MBL fold metallo-hydrolase [Chamaesiphon minutus]|uniref:Putative Zn-dependent hydrolase of beta-lactamase fold protein n=1 Tax=Chamaesiphon minutus (strain ATCC 27169 / PCC 6605) TaxID=1173020 RepID=K9UID4_CHAP6|nr:MBL fold metallo-hydrolase [Chamaesiphon minutus]AFY93959.1 putative Zn-dependent hydrolase of beta-lactamase fold protein [Chamaesiphon minutus PCC 6605]